MARTVSTILIMKTPAASAKAAYAFHQSQSLENNQIWFRDETEIRNYAERGELFSARKESDEFVALCYATLDEASAEYEIGGLTVMKALQDLGIATALINFALASVIANDPPWDAHRSIIAYIHEDNADPRNLIIEIGFEFVGRIKVGSAPATMKRNEKGEVVGDKYIFPRSSVRKLSRWLDEFDGKLRDQATPAVFGEYEPHTEISVLNDLRVALRSIVTELASK